MPKSPALFVLRKRRRHRLRARSQRPIKLRRPASSSAQQPVKLETERDDGADEAGVTGTSVPGCLALLLGEFALGQLTLNIAGHASSLGCLVV